MKYFYKVVVIRNKNQKSTLKIGKNYKKIHSFFEAYIEKNKNPIYDKDHTKNIHYIEDYVLLITNNPFIVGTGIENNKNYNILKQVRLRKEKKFFIYPKKRYATLNEIDFNLYDIIFIFLNKVVLQNKLETLLIICKNKKEAKKLSYVIKEKLTNIVFLGQLTKKNRKKYKDRILKETEINYKALFNSYIQ